MKIPPAATPANPTIPSPSWGAACSALSCIARNAYVRPDWLAVAITSFQAAAKFAAGSRPVRPVMTGPVMAAALGRSLNTLATAATSDSRGPDRVGSMRRNAAICRSTGAAACDPGPGRMVAKGLYATTNSAGSICSRTRIARATIWADSRAAATALGSCRAFSIASRVWATLKPPVNAFTIAWSARASNPSSASSIAEVDSRWRERIRAVAIHSHCAGPSDLLAATRNCPASEALSGARPARATGPWPAACRSGGKRRRCASCRTPSGAPSIVCMRKRLRSARPSTALQT